MSIDVATDDPAKRRDMLLKCAMTSMNSKLVSHNRPLAINTRFMPCCMSQPRSSILRPLDPCQLERDTCRGILVW